MTTERIRTLSVAFAPLALAACAVADNQSLTIDHFIPTSQATMCVADPTVMFSQSDGVLDVDLVYQLGDNAIYGYVLIPVVQNDIPERYGGMLVERDNIIVTAFEVELQSSKGGDLPFKVQTSPSSVPSARPHFSVPSALGVLAPAGLKQAALVEVLSKYAALQINGLDDKTWGQWDKIVVAHVRADGDHSGDSLQSAYLDFPITICKSCLYGGGVIPPCASLSKVTNVGSCNAPQDDPVTCCRVSDNDPAICGPAIPLGGPDGGTATDGGTTPDGGGAG